MGWRIAQPTNTNACWLQTQLAFATDKDLWQKDNYAVQTLGFHWIEGVRTVSRSHASNIGRDVHQVLIAR